MSRLIFILGETGTGKSSSICPPQDASWSLYDIREDENPYQALDSNSTFVINIQSAKDLPFKGSRKTYNKENRNYAETADAETILTILDKIEKDPNARIKTIIIDDFQYQMSFQMYEDLANKSLNWDRYKEYSLNWFKIFDKAKNMRADINVYIFSHSENKKAPGGDVERGMKTIGNMTDSILVPEGLTTIVLYTHVLPPNKTTTKDKLMPLSEYYFVTNRWSTYPAKSPAGMFSSILVPNSISFINQAIQNYY